MKDWDDARYLLAVAKADTFSAAARSLGVNQTTVSRRIERIEEELGFKLFSVKNGQLRPTASGASIIKECGHLEVAMANVDQCILSRSTDPVYRVTLAATETVSRILLAPKLGLFRQAHDNFRLTLITGQQNVRLDQGEADMAIRLRRPRTGRYKIRKLADLEFAAYGAKNLAKHIRPLSWLGYTEDLEHLPEAIWMSESMAGREPILRTNDVASLAEAAASGAGTAMLPCRLGDSHSGLRRMEFGPPPINREAWLIVREDVHQYSHIRAVADWIVDAFSAAN